MIGAACLWAGGANAIELSHPIACPPGANCFIQQLVDRDPTGGAADFLCGPMTYDGHQGVDFRVATFDQLRLGVPVLAAAPGKVRATRDGEPDNGAEGMAKGRDCGNGVVIDHVDGWSTQYCHLANGSLKVRQGETVAAGQPLGLMGFSGRTAFPHLHLTLRRRGEVVDPFDGQEASRDCRLPGAAGLWASPPELRLGGIIDAGFSADPPTLEAVREGLPEQGFAGGADTALVLWLRLFGLRLGDTVAMRLTGPDGAALAQTEKTLDRDRAVQFYFIGKKRPAEGWPTGAYRGEIILQRGGAMVERRDLALSLSP